MTVFLNSHLLGEVELVCDRVAIVDRGRVVRSGRLDEVVGGATRIRLSLDRVDPELLAALGREAEILAVRDRTVTLGVTGLDAAPRIADLVVRQGYRLFGLVPVQRSLEDVFVSLVDGGEG